MPNAVQSVVSNSFRTKLAQIYSGTLAWAAIDHFKIGAGAWLNTPSGKQPINPDVTFTTLQAGTGSYTGSSAFIFTKAITAPDLVYLAPQQVRIHCFVDVGEANDDGLGNPPQLFELAVFDADGVMVAYETFPMEVKTPDKSLEHFIIVDF